ncbi:lebercilin-like protein isoform X2 [Lissotriton helveticus]
MSSGALNSESPEDDGFFCAGDQGANNLVQCMKKRESIDSQRTSMSKTSSRHSCRTSPEHRDTKTRDSSSSRADSKSSFSEDSVDSGHKDLAESDRSPRTLEQSPVTKNVIQQKKKNASCANLPKGGMRYSWKKTQSWKSTRLKYHQIGGEKDVVAQRILSARLRRIKELKNELYEQQQKLEAIDMENKILKRLQLRHIKALGKFESTENDLHQLITQHNSEVRILRGLLKKSQEQERNASRKLKEADAELLRTKDCLQKLQKLSEDKGLEERGELSVRLLDLSRQLEADEHRIKGLERHLKLNTACFTRQLAAENRKTMEAREVTKKLQLDIAVLQQKLKEKERELDIKNIYANRLPKDLQKYDSSPHHRGVNLNKAVQTESQMFLLAQDGRQDPEDGDLLSREENEELNPDAAKKIQENEDRLKEEARLMQEQFEFMERKRKEEQEREAERLRRELARLVNEAENEEAVQEANGREPMDPSNMNRQTEGEEADTRSQRKTIPARLRRQYKFTEATENLHQGFPATGPISSTTNKNPTKNQGEDLNLELENSSVRYEPSFGRTLKSITQMQKGPEGKDGRGVETTMRDRKKSLMEELFGPGYSLKNSFSNSQPRVLSEEKRSPETVGEHASNAVQLSENVPFGDRKLIGQ